MPAKCTTQWVDENGKPTPDDNPATCLVWRVAYIEQYHGRAVRFSETLKFACCAEHAKQLSKPGMEHWRCEPLTQWPEPERPGQTIVNR